MKYILAVLVLTFSMQSFSGEPYYLIGHSSITSGAVMAVYGYYDNKTPCESTAQWTNEAMKEEGNSKTFSCAKGKEAAKIECAGSKNVDACMKSFFRRDAVLAEPIEY